VGVSQAEFVGTTSHASDAKATARRRAFGGRDFRDVLQRGLNLQVSVVAEGWVGTRGAVEQLHMFANAD
jgi:hypothetical protein